MNDPDLHPDPATLVQQTLAAAFAGNLTVLDDHPGLTSLRMALPKTFAAFSDFTAELQQVVTEGSRVATHWRLRGTHTGEFFGIQPTGKEVHYQNVSIAYVEQGRIVQFNSEVGYLSVLLQIGFLPVKGA